MADTELVVDTDTALTKAPQWSALSLTPIKTAEEYVALGERRKDIAAYKKRVKEFFRGTTDNPGPLTLQYRAYEKMLEREKDALAPAVTDEESIDKLLIDYDDEQTRLAAEEQKRLDEEEKKKAEDRAIDEAVALTALSQETGDPSFAQEAEAVLENVVPDTVFAEKATPKVSGLSIRANWKANRQAFQHQRDMRLLAAAALGITDPKLVAKLRIDTTLVNLLTVDWSAADKLAKATKGTAQVPGIAFFNDRGVASRAK